MKKSNFLFIQYLLLTIIILLGYTRCRCTPPPAPDTSQSSSTGDSDNNTQPPTIITQEMIDIVKDSIKAEPKLQFLLNRLQELKNGDKTNIGLQFSGNSIGSIGFYNFTALHCAASIGAPSIVAALLKLGASPILEDIDGESPFITSFTYNSSRVLETAEIFLNDPKVDSFINLKDKDGKSPRVRIEEKIKTLDLNKVDDYLKIKELLILREKMIEKKAKS